MKELFQKKAVISIIIPCYNVEAYIDRCLASIKVQTIGMENLEIICVDDASTDSTWERLLLWEQLYPEQVMLIRQEENRRQGAARNLGLQYASADWVSFVDADDWLEPDFFARLYGAAAQFDCDVVSCDHGMDSSTALVYFEESRRRNGGEERYIVADTEETTKILIRSSILGGTAWGKIIRKHLLTDFGIFFPEGLVYEDSYWTPLLHIYAKEIYVIEEKLYHYFVNPNSTVYSKNKTYHMDSLTVQMMKWADYTKRGIMELYREELEYHFLLEAAAFLKRIILQYDQLPFSLFLLDSELIRGWIPDWKSNLYAEDFAPFYRMLLEVLYAPADRAEFQKVSEQAKQMMAEWTID